MGYMSLGQKHFEKGIEKWGTPEAKTSFEECLKLDPDHRDARYNLALIEYHDHGNWRTCQLLMNPLCGYKDSYYYEGLSELNLGRRGHARLYFQKGYLTGQPKCIFEYAKLIDPVKNQTVYIEALDQIKEEDENYADAQFMAANALGPNHGGWYFRMDNAAKAGHEEAMWKVIYGCGYQSSFKWCAKLIMMNGEYAEKAWEKYLELERKYPNEYKDYQFRRLCNMDWEDTVDRIMNGKVNRLLIRIVMHSYYPDGDNWSFLRKWALSEDRTIDDYELLKTIVDHDKSKTRYFIGVAFKMVKMREDSADNELRIYLYKLLKRYTDYHHWHSPETLPECWFYLSKWSETGWGCDEDLTLAHEYLKYSAGADYRPAILKLAWKESITEPETIEQLTTAKDWYEKAGSIESLDGEDYERYYKVLVRIKELDEPETFGKLARELIERAEKGDPEAGFVVGLVYNQMGKKEKAKSWLEKSTKEHLKKGLEVLEREKDPDADLYE